MIELKKEFKKKGVVYTQLFNDEELVIYELSEASIDDPSEVIRWYEVFKYNVKQADIYHPEEFEKYPFDEAFGNWAWCCSTESSVGKVLNEHFPNHWLTKEMLNYVDGSYAINGIKKPYFKINRNDLIKSLS